MISDHHLKDLAEKGWNEFCDRGFEEFWLHAGITDDDLLAMIPVDPRKAVRDRALGRFFSFEEDYNPKNPTRFRIHQVCSLRKSFLSLFLLGGSTFEKLVVRMA